MKWELRAGEDDGGVAVALHHSTKVRGYHQLLKTSCPRLSAQQRITSLLNGSVTIQLASIAPIQNRVNRLLFRAL